MLNYFNKINCKEAQIQQSRVADKLPSGNLSAIFNRYIRD